MNRKGINYDVGTVFHGGVSSRQNLDPSVIKREMEIIKNDLHCSAVRISGREVDLLTRAAEFALQQELEVWFSPAFVDATEQETLDYFAACAQAAEKLRQQSPHVVFVAGCELTMFMKGLVTGDDMFKRMNTFMKPWLLLISAVKLHGSFNSRLNRFLKQAVSVVQQHFHGPVTYASGPWEGVDWSPFDFVSVDLYRDASNKNTFDQKLSVYFTHQKPVIITEFGCCPYRGAEDKGGLGWAIVNWNTTPPQLNGNFVRDEATQANYIADLLKIFDAEHAEGAFVYTFVNPAPYNPDPRYDLDMASYGVVKTLPDRKGQTYPDMNWEPKQAFETLAAYYAAYEAAPSLIHQPVG
jgi:hypothetical protein